MEFESGNALWRWVKSHNYRMLSIVRLGQPPRVIDPINYEHLDQNASYAISGLFQHSGTLAVKHNRVFDRPWEQRCRLRLGEWFEEEGLYLVELDRVLYDAEGVKCLAEWEGVWRGVDGTVYLLKCKYRVTTV
jgi:hypothetical protein